MFIIDELSDFTGRRKKKRAEKKTCSYKGKIPAKTPQAFCDEIGLINKNETGKFVSNDSFGFIYEDMEEEMLDLTSDANLKNINLTKKRPNITTMLLNDIIETNT
ncbi:hypothetical protein BDF21DRAFT_460827 [Thamnidium elegans]|nr:hypothetical protein BDF21DRAFT_460827 [Thamnidium elegans]